MSGSELEPRREQQQDNPYVKTAMFDGDQLAFEAYQKADDIIFGSECEVSAYRIRYKQVPYVVVLGLKPPQEIDDKITNVLQDGKSADLPADIIQTLTLRRIQAKRVGPWVEGHYRPGRTF